MREDHFGRQKPNGISRAYPFGDQPITWLAYLVTAWSGDAGYVSSLTGRLLAPNLIGDLATSPGSVSSIDKDLITCLINAHNRRTAHSVGRGRSDTIHWVTCMYQNHTSRGRDADTYQTNSNG
jgi:hypothetical protein